MSTQSEVKLPSPRVWRVVRALGFLFATMSIGERLTVEEMREVLRWFGRLCTDPRATLAVIRGAQQESKP